MVENIIQNVSANLKGFIENITLQKKNHKFIYYP